MNAKSFFTTIDERKIHYEVVFGADNTKKVENIGLILLHGWGGSTKSFTDENINQKGGLALRLADTMKINVLCLDYPGFGKSDFPSDSGWSSVEYADFLTKFLKKLKINDDVPLFGHSNGGRIIIRSLFDFPDFHNSRKLILCGASGIKLQKSKREKLISAFKKPLKQLSKLFPTKIKNLILKKVFKSHDWGACPRILKPTLSAITSEEDFSPKLGKINNNILLLWGKYDTMTPMMSGKKYHQGLKNSKLIIYEDEAARHGLHRTHTEQIADQITKFLHE